MKASTLLAASLACLAMAVPGFVQSSAARSAFEQKKTDNQYKALSTSGLNGSEATRYAPASPGRDAPSGVGKTSVYPEQPLYRGGREY